MRRSVLCLGLWLALLDVATVQAQAQDTARRPTQLPSVSVEAGAFRPARYNATTKFDEFYRRRARGEGTFFTREDIERSGKCEAVEILRGVAGVKVIRSKRDQTPSLQFARCGVGTLTRSVMAAPSSARSSLGAC